MSRNARRALGLLPRTVILLGLVSFFNDTASEMVVPLIPVWLLALGQGPIALGLIEGSAEAVSSLFKLWSGRRSDRLKRRKGFAVAGYALSNLMRPLIGFSAYWQVVLGLRAGDRIGKGLRTAPRDAMLADAAPAEIAAYAYGFHRAMDNLGAVLGALSAAFMLSRFPSAVSEVLVASAVPGAIAVLLMIFAVRETPSIRNHAAEPMEARPWRHLPVSLRRYLMVLAVFAAARASEIFVVLRARLAGMNLVMILILWAVFNGAKAVTAGTGGQMADRVGSRTVLLASWTAHAVAFALIGFTQGNALWIGVVFYGLCAGFGEGAERARVRVLAADHEHGAAFGWYHLVVGIAALTGGLLFGGVWHFVGPRLAFALSALLMGVAATLFARSSSASS
ncbi:MAG: MFS transporter [Acidiferrobacteraceae bacterium]